MERKVWYTTAAIMWLQNLLQERFGHTLHLHPQPENNCIAIHLPGHDRSITLALDGATFIRADSDLPCARWDVGAEGWHTVLSGELPAPGAVKLPTPLIASTENGVRIGYDILGLSYWMLTRQEEVGRTDLDTHGRFPATASHAYKHGYLERPIVDEWLEVLRWVVEHVWPGLPLKRNDYRMQLSHDVDFPARYGFSTPLRFLRSVAGDLVLRKDVRAALKAPMLYFGGRNQLHSGDPLNTFDWIMDRSEEYGMKSAFYFICGWTDRAHDALYDVDHPAIRTLIRRIHERGHEVGLHPSFNSYFDPGVIASEAANLKRVCVEEGVFQNAWGGRMHFLRWRHPETMRALDNAGMDYDSTLGYPERPGFRCGTCIEYQGFDPVAQEALSLRIRPLIAMDVSVVAKEYLGIGLSDDARAEFLRQKEACKRVRGSFSLLWHNSELESTVAKDFYVSILDSCFG